MSTRKLILFGALFAAAGCGDEFDPYNRLTALRVLAIRSEPPRPGPGETATLDALVYEPDGAPVTHAWSWCPLPGPASQGYPCLVTSEELATQAGGIEVPPLDLGGMPTAALPHRLPPALLQQLCARTTGDGEGLLDCTGGFPVQVRLKVTAGGDSVEAVTTLRLRFDPADAPNTNPQLAGFETRPRMKKGKLVGTTAPLDEMASVTIPRDDETKIVALPMGELAERYDDPKTKMSRRESLLITWFVESGDTRAERTVFNEQIATVPLEKALENEWTPAELEDYEGETARLFVVVRDNRGGVTWRSATVRLGEKQR